MTSISGQSPVSPSSNAYSAAGPTVSMVDPTSNAALSVTAVSLAFDAGVIATIGASAAASYTYDATGLFNSLVQAGTAATVSSQETGATSATAQATLDQAVAGSLPAASTSPTLYSASGALQAPTVDLNSSFASILKTDPGASGTVINDSFNQGIIGTISTSV